MTKSACTVLNTGFQIFNVITKNRCHLRHHTFQKSQKYLFSAKNREKKVLQLRCCNVLLHLKYKVLLCDPNIEFIIFAGEKALATDHRDLVNRRNVKGDIFAAANACRRFFQTEVETRVIAATLKVIGMNSLDAKNPTQNVLVTENATKQAKKACLRKIASIVVDDYVVDQK